MKYNLILIFCLGLVVNQKVMGEITNAIPSIAEIESINLFSHQGWQANFSQNGSGGIIYGSGPTDIATAPQGTFSFKDIYNLLVPHLSKNYLDIKSLAVSFVIKDLPPGTTIYSFYLDDKATIRKIMSEVQEKSKPLYDQVSFNELLKKHPLYEKEK